MNCTKHCDVRVKNDTFCTPCLIDQRDEWKAKADEKLPCGHHPSCLEEDQCRKPEHRYCVQCRNGECNNDMEKVATRLMKERDAFKKRCEIMENVVISARKVLHGYDGPTVDVANAVSSHVEGLRLSLSDFDKVEKSK